MVNSTATHLRLSATVSGQSLVHPLQVANQLRIDSRALLQHTRLLVSLTKHLLSDTKGNGWV